MTNETSDLVFWGDLLCGTCKRHVIFQWRTMTKRLRCPHCKAVFGLEEIISMAESYRPECSSVSDADLRRIVAEKLGQEPEQPTHVYFGGSFTNADGSAPTAPKPERGFWHPLEFTKNFLVGSAFMIGGQLLWELKQSIFGDDQKR